ncbi:TetR/AcrR family transcriptional regulator [Paenibacillaceae bacterium]|nr:TetR/AcrR family transcriptional regulator [Paenibacillaceae bacterium]
MTTQDTIDIKPNTQERILLTAEHVFAQKGYAGTRVNDIAEQAEVNVALISYYFESKEKLYHGVLDRLFHIWEQHVRDMSWNDDDPEKVLKEYIRKHYEFKWNNINMFRIFHWESLSEVGIYQQYIQQYWEKDVQEKLGFLKQWKRQGLLNKDLNEHVILALIWGMMDRLLFSKEEGLRLFLGMEGARGDLKELQRISSSEIVELAFHGIMPRKPDNLQSDQRQRVVTRINVVRLDGSAVGHCDTDEIMANLELADGVEVVHVEVDEGLTAAMLDGQGLLLIAHSQYGEMSMTSMNRMNRLESIAANGQLNGLAAAVWVIHGDRQAQSLQGILEQQLGRMGCYTLQRLIEQEPGVFARRFVQYTKRLQPCD